MNRQIMILRYLYENTDAEHSVSLREINDYLGEQAASRDTLYGDIKSLQECGFDIVCRKSTQNLYYLRSRTFELSEVKLLVDAVQAAQFISRKKSRELVERLASLVGREKREILKRELYIDSRNKADNPNLLEIVDLLHKAIGERKKVSFQYYCYNLKKEKALRHEGKRYRISPYDLIWSRDLYYLTGWNEELQKVAKFRVDRICSLEILEEKRTRKPADYRVSDFYDREFSMMSGEEAKVDLLCENALIDAICDKFGSRVAVKPVDEGHFRVTVSVSLSGTFYGWVFASRGKMKILGSKKAVEGFEECLKAFCEAGASQNAN